MSGDWLTWKLMDLGTQLPVVRTLTAGQRKVLELMAQHEDALDRDEDPEEDFDLVVGPTATGTQWFLGYHQVSARTGFALLRKVLVSIQDRSDDLIRFSINEEGRAALADPRYVPKIYAAIENERR